MRYLHLLLCALFILQGASAVPVYDWLSAGPIYYYPGSWYYPAQLNFDNRVNAEDIAWRYGTAGGFLNNRWDPFLFYSPDPFVNPGAVHIDGRAWNWIRAVDRSDDPVWNPNLVRPRTNIYGIVMAG